MGSPSKRRRRWLTLPLALLAGVLLLGVGAFLRGTWAGEPRDPENTADGPCCGVCSSPHGGKEVRCSLLLPFPMDEVWAVVTDYENFGDICPFLDARAIHYDPAGTTAIDASADAIPFVVEMRHEQELHQYTASWDQADGDVLVNRGAWTLRPVGPDETLLTVSLEVQLSWMPTFILRNVSLHRLPRVLLGVRRRLESGEPGRPW